MPTRNKSNVPELGTIWTKPTRAHEFIHSGHFLCTCIEEVLQSPRLPNDGTIDWEAVSVLMARRLKEDSKSNCLVEEKDPLSQEWTARACKRLWQGMAYGYPLAADGGDLSFESEDEDAYLQPYRAMRRYHLSKVGGDVILDETRPRIVEEDGRRSYGGGSESEDDAEGTGDFSRCPRKLRRIVTATEVAKERVRLVVPLDPEGLLTASMRPTTAARLTKAIKLERGTSILGIAASVTFGSAERSGRNIKR
jgi:hypothetical protein